MPPPPIKRRCLYGTSNVNWTLQAAGAAREATESCRATEQANAALRATVERLQEEVVGLRAARDKSEMPQRRSGSDRSRRGHRHREESESTESVTAEQRRSAKGRAAVSAASSQPAALSQHAVALERYRAQKELPEDLSEADAHGWTCMHHLASDSAQMPVEGMMAEVLAAISTEDVNVLTTGGRPAGWAPLHFVANNADAANQRPRLIAMLVRARANLELLDASGSTPLLRTLPIIFVYLRIEASPQHPAHSKVPWNSLDTSVQCCSIQLAPSPCQIC